MEWRLPGAGLSILMNAPTQ